MDIRFVDYAEDRDPQVSQRTFGDAPKVEDMPEDYQRRLDERLRVFEGLSEQQQKAFLNLERLISDLTVLPHRDTHVMPLHAAVELGLL